MSIISVDYGNIGVGAYNGQELIPYFTIAGGGSATKTLTNPFKGATGWMFEGNTSYIVKYDEDGTAYLNGTVSPTRTAVISGNQVTFKNFSGSLTEGFYLVVLY